MPTIFRLCIAGNARTSCNGNSSRFGKYIVLQYDTNQCLVGAHIQAYLLEKTRVVYQNNGNSNFHIFYQVCASSLYIYVQRKSFSTIIVNWCRYWCLYVTLILLQFFFFFIHIYWTNSVYVLFANFVYLSVLSKGFFAF